VQVRSSAASPLVAPAKHSKNKTKAADKSIFSWSYRPLFAFKSQCRLKY
jgi:hypothetical protein